MERCLRLLKKGGRMGMVLPEGVLNNKNLAAVREYFEEHAKLIFICSLPQDVFIAAGATVKPSLVFMRRFTAEEEIKYAECKNKVINEVKALHKTEIDVLEKTIADCNVQTNSLKDELKNARNRLRQVKKEKKRSSAIEAEIATIQQKQENNKITKKAAEKELADIHKLIAEEVRSVVKKKFDYDIPIAKVEDAGITTTGAASEGNQLPTLVKEYKTYNEQNHLWDVCIKKYDYKKNPDGKYCRLFEYKEEILNG